MEKRGGGGGGGSSDSPLPPMKRLRLLLSHPPVVIAEDVPTPPRRAFEYVEQQPQRVNRTREGGGRDRAAREQFERRERKWREDMRRLATRRGRLGRHPNEWWPTAEQWRLALYNAQWKEEMDRRGVPYQTNQLSLEELRRWEEYFKTQGFDPEANQDFFDEDFVDDNIDEFDDENSSDGDSIDNQRD